MGRGWGCLLFTSLRDYVQSSLLLPVLTLGPLPVESSPFQTEGTHPVVYQFSGGKAEWFDSLPILKQSWEFGDGPRAPEFLSIMPS